ncbi:glycoside hydrolase family 16 protein [Paenibacillus sp. FA6]|uniref:glycoside hydrolase family 16 protein n=1 Tax=Paenibacillus sp. FA6 TaxID=3413029 RepID=UPI003F65D8B8
MRIISRTVCSAMIFIILLMGCSTIDNQTTILQEKNGWKLVWNDEFEGKEIDTMKWQHETGGWGFGNNEDQFYTNDSANSYIDNGKLVIKALKQEHEGKPYTSAKLITKDKADWTYGRFEFRAKLPIGQGMWPAIWMMPTDMDKYGGWPSSGEIDIMESLGHAPDQVHGTLHMGNPHYYKGGQMKLNEGSFAEKFHVFALEWTPTEMRWYVDDKEYYHTSSWFTRKDEKANNEPGAAPFNREFYIQLNLAVGGNWPGYPDETTIFPQTFEIDYVRVYQPDHGNYDLDHELK